MQPVIQKKNLQHAQNSAIKMEEIVVGDVEAVRTWKREVTRIDSQE